MKFPRTVRHGAADLENFPTAAEPGEWAVSGAFVFSDREPAMLLGKDLQAFRTGFLGAESFGWSSLVEVGEISPSEYEEVVEQIATYLMEEFAAPDRTAALSFANEEGKFAQSLCDRPLGTLVAVERSFGPQGISERFRTVEPGEVEKG
ncbi:MAG TPA: DUF6505 family protein [Stellaceae bacterium]|nr:DUF6505 family protein [Stellaceae bacterium]